MQFINYSALVYPRSMENTQSNQPGTHGFSQNILQNHCDYDWSAHLRRCLEGKPSGSFNYRQVSPDNGPELLILKVSPEHLLNDYLFFGSDKQKNDDGFLGFLRYLLIVNKNFSIPTFIVTHLEFACSLQNGREGILEYISNADEESETKLFRRFKTEHLNILNNSNIWFRLIDFDNIEQEFPLAIESLKCQLGSDYYKAEVAKESLEFQLRLTENNYLEDGTHSNHIVPFLFHNELFFKKLSKSNENRLHGYRWRILLIDDQAETNVKGLKLTKREIIEELLKEMETSLGSNRQIELIACSRFEEITEVIKNKAPDIILLDYLLDDKEPGQNTQKRWLGSEVLKKLEDDVKAGTLKTEKQPLGYFWIMPISAFTHTMQSDLKQKGIQYFNRLWMMSDGADPINTPELFKFKLSELMIEMVDRAGYEEIRKTLSQNEMFKNDVNKNQDIDFLNYFRCFFPETKVKLTVRRKFREIVDLKSDFSGLHTIKDSSPFAKSVIRRLYKDIDEATFDHILNLCYLIAYGNRLQAKQMWEEYNFIRLKLKNKGITDNLKELEHYLKSLLTDR